MEEKITSLVCAIVSFFASFGILMLFHYLLERYDDVNALLLYTIFVVSLIVITTIIIYGCKFLLVILEIISDAF